jgi:hypothetical protein
MVIISQVLQTIKLLGYGQLIPINHYGYLLAIIQMLM